VNAQRTKLLAVATATAVTAGLGGQALTAAHGDTAGPEANASASPRKNATFKGRTSQGKGITFKVSRTGRTASISRLGYRAKCVKGGTVSATLRRAPRIGIRRGRLRLSSHLVGFFGKFTSGRRASGTFHISSANLAGRRCNTGTIRWSVRN
jgi:hypothetical protein